MNPTEDLKSTVNHLREQGWKPRTIYVANDEQKRLSEDAAKQLNIEAEFIVAKHL